MGYTSSLPTFNRSRPGPVDFSLPSGLLVGLPLGCLQAPGVAMEHCGGQIGAEGEEWGAGGEGMEYGLKRVGLVAPVGYLACVFTQLGRKQEVERRK